MTRLENVSSVTEEALGRVRTIVIGSAMILGAVIVIVVDYFLMDPNFTGYTWLSPLELPDNDDMDIPVPPRASKIIRGIAKIYFPFFYENNRKKSKRSYHSTLIVILSSRVRATSEEAKI